MKREGEIHGSGETQRIRDTRGVRVYLAGLQSKKKTYMFLGQFKSKIFD